MSPDIDVCNIFGINYSAEQLLLRTPLFNLPTNCTVFICCKLIYMGTPPPHPTLENVTHPLFKSAPPRKLTN